MVGMEQTPIKLVPNSEGQLGILPAISHAMRLVGAVGKDGYHEGGKSGNFPYRSTDAVWTALSEPLGEAGIVVIPSSEPITMETIVTEGWGKTATSSIGLVAMHRCHFIIAGPDGSYITTSIVVTLAPTKPQNNGAALAYASKYVLSQVFALPFDDPHTDVDHNDFQPQPTTATQRQPVAGNTRTLPGGPNPARALPEGPQPDPGVDPGRVLTLLARLKNNSSHVKEAFRTQAKAQTEAGSSWSFQESHTWTATEIAAAEACIAQLEAADPDHPTNQTDTNNPATKEAIAKVIAGVEKRQWEWDSIIAAANEDGVVEGGAMLDTRDEFLERPECLVWLMKRFVRADGAAAVAAGNVG